MVYGIIFKIEQRGMYENRYIVEKVVKGYRNSLDVVYNVLSTTETIKGAALAHKEDGEEYEKDTYILDTNIVYAKYNPDNPENNYIEHENLFCDNKSLPYRVKAEVGKELEVLTYTWD